MKLYAITLLCLAGCNADVLPDNTSAPAPIQRMSSAFLAAGPTDSGLTDDGSTDATLPIDASLPTDAGVESGIVYSADASIIVYGVDGNIVFSGNYPDLTTAINTAVLSFTPPDLTGAQFQLSVFSHDGLTLIDMQHRVSLDGGVQAPYSNWTSAYAPGSNFSDVNFTGANFTHANLRASITTQTHFENAIMRGVILSDSNLNNSVFRGADLTGAKLSPVDCECVDFRGAIGVETIDWGASDLGGTIFDNSAFDGAGCPFDTPCATNIDWDANHLFIGGCIEPF